MSADAGFLFLASLAANALLGAIIFLLQGGLRLGDGADGSHVAVVRTPLTREQGITWAALALLAVGALVLDVNIGFVAMGVIVLLSLCVRAGHAEAEKRVGWSTVLLICGIVTYLGVLEKTGTVGWLGEAVRGVGSPLLAELLLCMVAGVVSAFASSTALLGVLIPLAAPLLTTGELAAAGLLAAIAVSTTVVDTSPFSTDGALVVASALAYVAAVRAVDAGRSVLEVEHHSGQANAEFVAVENPSEPLRVRGNLPQESVLHALALDRAHRAVVIGDDDLLNLECAWAVNDMNPSLPVAVHVADLALLRPVNRMARPRRDSGGARGPSVFSTRRIAALGLYDENLGAHFEHTGARDDVVIAGFGRLGQTFLELLLARAEEEVARVPVVEPGATHALRQFAADVDTPAIEVLAVDGALDDLGTWERVGASLASGQGASLALLAHADSLLNLRAAMLLRAALPSTRGFVRCFGRTAFTDALAAQLGMEMFSLEDMLRDALRDHYEALSIA